MSSNRFCNWLPARATAVLLFLVVVVAAGCSSAPDGEEVAGKIRQSLGDAGITGVEVSFTDGQIVLSGEAEQADRDRALEMARADAGDFQVMDRITVVPSAEELARQQEEERLRQQRAACGEGIAAAASGNIEFATDSASVRTRYGTALDAVAEAANADGCGEVGIELHGHADRRHTDEYNQRLSERRAESVAKALAERGVDAGRIRTVGHGEQQPLSEGDTAEAMQRNRRVEVRAGA